MAEVADQAAQPQQAGKAEGGSGTDHEELSPG